jgi:hypothetical protein
MRDRLEDAYEAASNKSLRAAIDGGHMRPVAGVHDAFVLARGCAGGGEVRFKFERALAGVYPSAFGTPQVGVYVSISATLLGCGAHPRVRAVQVCREILRGADGAMRSVRPRDEIRVQRSGYLEADAPSLGWRVDQAHGHDSVYWTDGGRRDGRDGSSERPLRLLDAPASLPDAETGAPATNIGKEFRTCVTSDGVVLACLEWGYFIDAQGAVAMYPARPIAYPGAGREVFDAIARWDATPGHAASGIRRASEH